MSMPYRVLSFFFVFLFGAAGASAQERAVVLDFEGTGAERARGEVVAALSPHVSLTQRQEIYRRARVENLELREAARRAGVTLIVRGRVTDGVSLVAQRVDGRVLDEQRAPAPRNRRATRELHRKSRVLVRRAVRQLSAPPPRPRATAAPRDTAADDDTVEGAEEGLAFGLPPIVDMQVGIGVRSRDADVAMASGARRRYRSGLFPQVVGFVETRPFRSSGRWASGLVGRLAGGAGIGLTTLDEDENVLSTTVFEVGIDVGYLIPLDFAEIGLLVGIGIDAFQLPEDSALFPSTDYLGARVALVGRVPLSGRAVMLDLEAAVRFVFDSGALSERFSASSSTLGFDVAGGIRGESEFGMTYGIHIGMRRYGTTFGGVPAIPDEEAWEGVDLSFVAGASLGFRITE